MKRPAVYLFIFAATVGWAATGHAKKASKPAAPAAEEGGARAERRLRRLPRQSAPAESLDTSTDEIQAGKVEDEIGRAGEGRRSPDDDAQLAGHPRRSTQAVHQGRPPGAGAVHRHHDQRQPDSPLRVRQRISATSCPTRSGSACRGNTSSSSCRRKPSSSACSSTGRRRSTDTCTAGSLDFGYVPAYGKFALVNRTIVHWENLGVGRLRRDVHRGDSSRSRGGSSRASRPPR